MKQSVNTLLGRKMRADEIQKRDWSVSKAFANSKLKLKAKSCVLSRLEIQLDFLRTRQACCFSTWAVGNQFQLGCQFWKAEDKSQTGFSIKMMLHLNY